LIAEFGSLREVVGGSQRRIRRIAGKGVAKLLRAHAELLRCGLIEEVMRRPVLANREALFNFLQQEIAFAPQECLLALFVDSRCGLIRSEIISAGTVSSTSADPFPLFQRGKELGAAALFLVHNHPSRDPRPSRPDILVTHRLKRIGHDLEMPLLDHFIVTPGEVNPVPIE